MCAYIYIFFICVNAYAFTYKYNICIKTVSELIVGYFNVSLVVTKIEICCLCLLI